MLRIVVAYVNTHTRANDVFFIVYQKKETLVRLTFCHFPFKGTLLFALESPPCVSSLDQINIQ